MKRALGVGVLLGSALAIATGAPAIASTPAPDASTTSTWVRAGSYPASICPDAGAKAVRENARYTAWNCDWPDPGYPENRILMLKKSAV